MSLCSSAMLVIKAPWETVERIHSQKFEGVWLGEIRSQAADTWQMVVTGDTGEALDRFRQTLRNLPEEVEAAFLVYLNQDQMQFLQHANFGTS